MPRISPAETASREPLNQEALDALRGGPRGPSFAPPQRSLGEILDWMLAPLFLLWPMSVAITYVVAQNIANVPYDRALANNLNVLSHQVHAVDGRAALRMTDAARDVLRVDETESVFWLALGSRGEYLGGDRALPLPPNVGQPRPGEILYADDTLRGFGVRLAYTWIDLGLPDTQPALVMVAETVEKRAQLANDIIKGVIIPQFVVLPIAVLLVWFGLSRGVAPLNALQQRLRARRPTTSRPSTNRPPLRDRAAGRRHERPARPPVGQHRNAAPLRGRCRAPAQDAPGRPAHPGRAGAARRQPRGNAVQPAPAGHRLRTGHPAGQPVAAAGAGGKPGLARPGADRPQRHRLRTDDAMVPQALALSTDLGFEGADRPVGISGNAILLAELLNNLIDNALRYTRAAATSRYR